jgi:hypothetical protein
MTFTDDLKRLKESIGITPDPEKQKGRLLALLAEAILERPSIFKDESYYEDLAEKYRAWRKAAGK